MRAAFAIALALMLVARPAAAVTEGTTALQLCGTLKEHRPATASAAGSLTIGTRTYAVAPGIRAASGGVEVAVGRDLCVEGSVGRVSGQLVRYLFFPLPPDGQVCGNVVRQATAGGVTISAEFGVLTLTLGPGLGGPAADARVCYAFEVERPGGDLVAVRSQPVDTRNEREWIAPCGTVRAYTAATAEADGAITIGSRTYAIARGTSYTGDPAGDRADRTTVGTNACLRAVLGETRSIIEYLTAAMTAHLAGTASEYTPPAGGAPGLVVLSYRSHFELKIPSSIADAVDLGRGSYCYSIGVDGPGDVVATALAPCGGGGAAGPSASEPPSMAAPAGPVHHCGIIVSYMPARANLPGSLVIGTTGYATSPGGLSPGSSSPVPFRQVIAPGAAIGAEVCLDGTVATSLTTANLLTDFTVTPAAAPTPSRTPSSASASPIAPLMPEVDGSAPAWSLLLGAAGIGVVAIFVWLRFVRSRGTRA